MFKRLISRLQSAFEAVVPWAVGRGTTPRTLDLRGVGSNRLSSVRNGQTKAGSGRSHHGRKPRQRLRPAVHGGSWQGRDYLTYVEHDAITRSYLAMPSIPRDDPFHLELVKATRPK